MTYYNVQDSIYITASEGGNVGIGVTNPSKKFEVVGDIDATTDYNINGTQVLSATTLGSGVVNSSLTSNTGNLSNDGTINVSSGNDYKINSASVLSATTLGSSVVNSSLTSNTGNLSNDGTMNISSGNDYKINSASVLSSTTLGSSVVNSSLTNVGTLSALNVVGNTSLDGAVVLERANSTNEGGEIRLKMSDDSNTWKIDCYGGSTSQQDLRLFSSASGNKVKIQSDLEVNGSVTQGATTLKGHIIPDTNDAYDIGSAEFKIRDMYVSDNSLWVGDEHKISISGGKMKFRKRKTSSVPAAVLAAAQLADGSATESSVGIAAVSHANVLNLSSMKLKHWRAYMRTIAGQSGATIQDIFRDNTDDYSEESETNWLQSGTKTYNTTGNLGVGTSDPAALLHLHFDPEASQGLKELLRLSWNDANYDTLKGDGTKISFNTSNTNNFPGGEEGGYVGVMKANAVEADTECDFSLGLNNGTSVVERLRILSTGYVGIGNDTPTHELDVAGDINFTGTLYQNGSAFSSGSESVWDEASSIASYDNAVRIGSTTGLVTGQSNFQANNSFIAGKGYLDVPWINTCGIEHYDEKGTGSTGMIFGSDRYTSSMDLITFVTVGENRVQIDASGLIIKELGDLTFQRSDESESSTISSNNEGFTISESRGGNITKYQMGGNDHIFYTANTERLRIDSSGNVGIGTNSPVAKLHIDSGEMYISNGNHGVMFAPYEGWFFRNKTANMSSYRDCMRIDNAGNVGIGYNSPSYKLDVNGDIRTGNRDKLILSRGGIQDPFIQSPAGKDLGFFTIDFERMRIKNNGNIGIGTTEPLNELVIHKDQNDFTTLEIRNNNTNNNTSGTQILFGGYRDVTQTTHSLALIRCLTQAGDINQVKAGALAFHIEDGNNSDGTAYGSLDEMMRLTSTGLGIGTNSPVTNLHSSTGSNSGNHILMTNNSTGHTASDGFRLGIDGSNHAYIWQNEGAKMRFGTSNTERMVIDTGGNVGIGTNSPNEKLQVVGDIRFGANGKLVLDQNSWQTCGNIELTSGSGMFGFHGTGGNTLGIYVDGDVKCGGRFVFDAGEGLREKTGQYGTVQTVGGDSWSGYSIEGRYVFMSDSNNHCGVYNDIDNKWIWLHDRDSSSTGHLKFYVAGGEKIRIHHNGNMVLGATSSTYNAKLWVQGLSPTYNNVTYGYLNRNSPTGIHQPSGGSSQSYSIGCNGRSRASEFNAMSDVRKKKDFVEISDDTALDLLNQIKVYNFKWKGELEDITEKTGVKAQEIEQIYPSCVNQSREAIPSILEEVTYNNYKFNLTDVSDLEVGDKLRIFYQDKEDQNIEKELEAGIVSINGNEVEIDTEIKDDDDQIYIYGKVVDDVRNIDYNSLNMLSIGAIKSLVTKNNILENKLSSLESELAAIKTHLGIE